MSRGIQYSVLSTQYLVLCTRYCGPLAIVCLIASAASAAPPKINNLFPAGAQQGQTVTVTAAGDFSTWPANVWFDRSGLAVTAEKDKGKFTIDVAKEAAPGTYWLRAYNADGASTLRPFIVGTLAETAETEPNDTPDKPQAITGSVVINGKLGKSGDVDGFRMELKSGETLVASLQANSTVGSPMDAVLQICQLAQRRYTAPSSATSSGESHGVEAYVAVQNHDAIGLDPQIAFTVPATGDYLVRVFAFPATPDSSVRFAGGDDYIYRLTLTTGPYVDHALPLAVPLVESQVELGGWNLPPKSTTIVAPFGSVADPLTPPDGPLAWIGLNQAAGAFAVARVDTPVMSATASELTVPGTVSKRLSSPNQVDTYLFSGTKGQKLRIRVVAKALGFPTDTILAVLDSAGAVLAEADDTGRDDRDPQLEFTPPADGKYSVTVKDLAGRSGPRLVYRLSIEPVLPDFSLALAADSFILEKDKPLEIPVNLAVRDGLRDPIELHAVGLPPGIIAEPVTFTPSGDSPMPDSGGGRRSRRSGGTPTPAGPSAKLILKAESSATLPGGAAFRIEGRVGGSSPVTRTARFPLNLPLAGSHHAAWLTIKN